NRGIQVKNKFSMNTDYELNFDVFSDNDLLDEFIAYEKKYDHEAMYVASTSYFFDEQGKFAKTIWIPERMKVDREVIYDYGRVKDCLSEMTEEDFMLADRALTRIEQRLEDWVKRSK